MKLHITIIGMLLGLMSGPLASHAQQNQQQQGDPQPITRSYALEITDNKTSSIIFPALIKSVDKGSRDVLAQKAKETGNVLQLKAGRENFPETNLTVITAEGILYHFTLNYLKEPNHFTFDMNRPRDYFEGIDHPESSYNKSKLIFASDITEPAMEEYASAIVNSKRIIHFKSKTKYKVSLSLLGIYIKDNVIFYRLHIMNNSNINYDVEFLKFYVRDNSKIKRTASQEIEEHPIYRYGEVSTVKGKSESEVVYALEKFTIPDSKHLAVELFEKRGGRHYTIRIKNSEIVKARKL